MAISFTKYVDITSGVGAGTVVAQRELIGRLFTNNLLVPSQTFIDFDSADEVLAYFGSTSEEYKRAAFYFAFISKNITSANKITFARWVDTAEPPLIFGARLTTTLAALKLITNGSFSLTLGTDTHVISTLDFSGASTLADVASLIQAGITAQTGVQWTGATVSYNVSRGAFNFVGGSAVNAVVVVAPGNVGVDISGMIGWLPESVNGSSGAIWSNGSAVETITNVLSNSAQASNNFGSFLFMPTLTDDQIVEAATWNNTQNVLYQYMVRVPNATKAALYGDPVTGTLIDFAGVGMTLAPLSTEYPEMCPMMVLAATDYTARNSTQNYMFQIFGNLTPSVTTTSDSNLYDGYRVNYYGQTQTAGQFIQFYQRGVLTGLAVNPVDMNTYANEQWLKDAMGAAIMTLLLALSKISANAQGRAQILSTLQSIIDLAITNGTISLNGILTNTQKLFIAQISGDPNAWYQVQNIGYWIDCEITSTVNNNIVEFSAEYTLIYKKDDIIRSVQGTHVLI